MHQIRIRHSLFFIFLLVNCLANNEYYTLLDSTPAVDFYNHQTIPLPDQKIAFSMKGALSTITARPDTSFRLLMFGGGLHLNISRAIGMSFIGTSLFSNEHCFYGSIDTRYWLIRKNPFLSTTLGLSAGSGIVGPLGDIHCIPSLLVTLRGMSCWYLAPRIIILSYPVAIETGIIPSIDYELAAIWGINTGFNIKIFELRPGNSIMAAPEFSLIYTRETRTNTTIQPWCITLFLAIML